MTLATSIAGKHAVVTGGAKGIGRAIADALARRGAKVSVMSRTATEYSSAYASVDVDVTDEDAVSEAFTSLRERHGPVLILVNNSGLAESAPVLRTSLQLWKRTIATNLTATFLCSQIALADMLAANFGRIVNIASVAGLSGAPYIVAYAASKHGVIGLTRAMAVELQDSGVTVNAVCPGYTESEMLERAINNVAAKTGKTTAEARGQLASMNPGGRMVEPHEVAAAVIEVCESDANGQEIVLPR